MTRALRLLALLLLVGSSAGAVTVVSRTSGNLTTASTWGTVDATSLLDSEAGSTALTTSYVQSSATTPGAITIDGFAVKLANRTGTTGTMSCELYNSTDAAAVAATLVTINTADLPAALTSVGGSWIMLGFTATTLTAGKAYKVECKTSSVAMVNIYRDSTAGNWSRILRTTTTAAPGAGDNMIVAGEYTGAGTGNDFTVTMDSTAATDYGSAGTTVAPAALAIGGRGTLTWGTSASTTYILQLSGWLTVGAGGLMNIGTNATRMPATSTATLQFDCAADGDFGLVVRSAGSLEIHGDNSRTTPWTTLTTDEAAASTVIGVASTTGWAAGDELVFPATTRTYTEYEHKTIQTVDSATQVTLTAGLTYAHTGTGVAVGEVGNLTRNVVIRSVSTTAMAFAITENSVIGEVDIDYALFRYLGTNTVNKYGLFLAGDIGSGTQYVAYNVFRNADGVAFYVNAGSKPVTFDHNVVYDSAQVIAAISTRFDLPTTGSSTVTNNLIVGIGGSSNGCVYITDVGGIITGNVVASCVSTGVGGYAFYPAGSTTGVPYGTFSGNIAHSNRAVGFDMDPMTGGTLSTSKSWRNGTVGVSIGSNTGATVVFTGWSIYGNVTAGIMLLQRYGDFEINDSTIAGEASYAQARGIYFSGTSTLSAHYQIRGSSVVFGSGTSLTTHGTADVDVKDVLGHPHLTFINSTFASGTEVANLSSALGDAYVACQRCDTTAGNHWIEKVPGRIVTDTAIYDATPSMRMTPRSASVKLSQVVARANVENGATVTPSVKVRESIAGAETDYNGARIRLLVLRNDALGITSDTVLATATVSSEGAFETISAATATVTDAGVLEFAIDCDGTTGWVNVDTITLTNQSTSSGTMVNWFDGQPTVIIPGAGGGGSSPSAFAGWGN